MNTPARRVFNCDAVGCPCAATWCLVERNEEAEPVYLCDRHLDHVRERNWRQAARFQPLSGERADSGNQSQAT